MNAASLRNTRRRLLVISRHIDSSVSSNTLSRQMSDTLPLILARSESSMAVVVQVALPSKEIISRETIGGNMLGQSRESRLARLGGEAVALQYDYRLPGFALRQYADARHTVPAIERLGLELRVPCGDSNRMPLSANDMAKSSKLWLHGVTPVLAHVEHYAYIPGNWYYWTARWATNLRRSRWTVALLLARRRMRMTQCMPCSTWNEWSMGPLKERQP
jgi:hypothetical protein